jgi:hypothetical protein
MPTQWEPWPEDMSRWHIEHEIFVPGLPIFNISNGDLDVPEIIEAFMNATKERAHAIYFSVDGEDGKMLSLVVEGLRVVESGPYSAMRGEPWHHDGPYWVISGWACVFEDVAYKRETLAAGPCRVMTTRIYTESGLVNTDDLGSFYAQIQPPPRPHSVEQFRYLKDLGELPK